jgi:hypothetical protein
MSFRADTLGVTTVLLLVFALFVLYTRFKNWLDSNIPIFFYILLVIFINSVPNEVYHPLAYAAFALGLLLRFEFMNTTAARFIKLLEACAIALIIWQCRSLILN